MVTSVVPATTLLMPKSVLEVFKEITECLKSLRVLLGESMYLMLVLGRLYIYSPVAPSHCGCYKGFNTSFGNASWSMM